MDVTVIVATYGDRKWHDLAMGRAVPSAATQTRHKGDRPVPVRVYHHDQPESCGQARNQAVAEFDPQGWIVFLDADDALAPGYIATMEKVGGPWGRLMVPRLQHRGGKPVHFQERDIRTMNPCPIGTAIHRSVFDDVGGFWDEEAWEDWSLFRRAFITGANLMFVDSVYQVPREGGRNRSAAGDRKLRDKIIASHDAWLAEGRWPLAR